MRWLIVLTLILSACFAPHGAQQAQAAGDEPAVRAPEAFVTNLLGYWRADAFADGKLTDLSGNHRDLTATNLPVVTTTLANGWGIAGRPLVASGGAAASYATASEAPHWKPMHDGSGASWWVVLRETETGMRTIFDTGGATSTADCGITMRIDGDRGRINLELTNGGANGYLIDNVNGAWCTWNGTFEVGKPHVLVVTFNTADSPNIHLWLDGRLVGSLTIGDREKPTPPTRKLGAADPAYPLRLLASNRGLFLFAGELAEFGVASGTLAADKRRAIEDWAAAHYGIPLNRKPQGILLWDGNSLVDNIWRTGQFPEDVTPRLRLPQRVVMRAIAGLTVQQMIDRAPKHVTPVYDPQAPFNILAVSEVLNSLAEGETKENTYNQLVSYCKARRTEGWKVVVATPLPAGAGIKRADLDWVKDQMIANWTTFADAIVRADLDPHIGSWDAWSEDLKTKKYRGEGVHFTRLGNETFAPYWVTAINEVMLAIEKGKGGK